MSQGRPTPFTDVSSIGESSPAPVVLFAATRWELAAIRRALPQAQRAEIEGVSGFTGRQAGRTYWLVPTGIGPKAAQAAASAVLNRGAALAVSAGFAGALVGEASVGDVVVATSVVAGTFEQRWMEADAPIACDEAVVYAMRSAAAAAGIPVRTGRMVSLAVVLSRSAEKQELSRLAGAVAVDMESAAIGIAAGRLRVPFAVLRTVSDAAHDDLPLDFNAFLKPWGWVRGMSDMVLRPSSLVGLLRLRRHCGMAADALTAATAGWAAKGFGLSPLSQGRSGG